MNKAIVLGLIICMFTLCISCGEKTLKEPVNTLSSMDNDVTSNDVEKVPSQEKFDGVLEESTFSVSDIIDAFSKQDKPYRHIYSEQEIFDFHGYGFGSSRSLYGRRISYLGQTTTKSGYNQIYIQSSPRQTLYEKEDNVTSSKGYHSEVIAIRVNDDPRFGFSWGTACQEQWSYTIPGVNVFSICFDEDHVFISTTEGPEWYTYKDEYNIFCFDKESGKQIWKQSIPSPVFTEMLIYQNCLLCCHYAFNMDTGDIVDEFDECVSGIQIEDCLYKLSFQSGCLSINQYSLKTKTNSVVWKNDSFSTDEYLFHHTTPVVVDEWLCFTYSVRDSFESPYRTYLLALHPKNRRLAWSIELDDFHEIADEILFDGKYLYISNKYTSVCLAYDPFNNVECWKTSFENQKIGQIFPCEENIYVILIKEEIMGRWGISYDHQALLLDRETGLLCGKSPPINYSGIASIEDKYKDYLITRGYNGAFLDFHPIITTQLQEELR
jgi:outer membrane protein assembly factor BamB